MWLRVSKTGGTPQTPRSSKSSPTGGLLLLLYAQDYFHLFIYDSADTEL